MRKPQLRVTILGLAVSAMVTSSFAPVALAEEGKKAAPDASERSREQVWFVQAMNTTPTVGLAISYFWSKGRKLRVSTIVQGQPILTLVSGDWYYAIDVLGERGLAIARSAKALAEDAKGGRPFANEAQLIRDRGGEIVRTDQLGSLVCDIYRLTDEGGRREVWVPQKGEDLPLRVEVFDRATGETRRIDYVGWATSLHLPDSFFDPDPRVELEELTYDEYLKRAGQGPVGPIPVLYGYMLHGE